MPPLACQEGRRSPRAQLANATRPWHAVFETRPPARFPQLRVLVGEDDFVSTNDPLTPSTLALDPFDMVTCHPLTWSKLVLGISSHLDMLAPCRLRNTLARTILSQNTHPSFYLLLPHCTCAPDVENRVLFATAQPRFLTLQGHPSCAVRGLVGVRKSSYLPLWEPKIACDGQFLSPPFPIWASFLPVFTQIHIVHPFENVLQG